MGTSPVRIADEDVAVARIAADVLGRSTAQQLAHWARIGRELEAAPTTTVSEVSEVLAGAHSYDDLDGRGQARVRAAWVERLKQRLDATDLLAEFEAAGHAYATLDKDGNVVMHGDPDGGSQRDRPTDRAIEALRDVLATARQVDTA